MKPISTSELLPMEFGSEAQSQKVRAQSGKIGWVHSVSDVPGVKFDLVIKDSLGRIKLQKKDCGGNTERFGELVNLPTFLGEELEIVVENLRGASKINLFLN
ncbi:MAG: hypothetical protein HY456_00795 [Parcubacteria group bacterium]|nr:hypothetical protein [Parcubacteria group bacterium]